MQKNKNRQGLALGAMVSLVASMFIGVTPAQAAVVALPNTGTTYETIAGETFAVKFIADSSKPVAVKMSATGHSGSFDVNLTSGPNNSLSSVAVIATGTGTGAANTNLDNQATAAAVRYVSSYSALSVNQIKVALAATTSGTSYTPSNVPTNSGAVTVTLDIWEDIFVDGVWDRTNEVGQTVTVRFNPWSILAPAVTMDLLVGDTYATASATVTGVNLSQLSNNFGIALVSSESASLKNAVSVSATSIADGSVALSDSASVAQLGGGHTVSAQVLYANRAIGAAVVKTAAALTYNRITISPIVGDNLVGTGGTTADARINSALTLHAYAQTGSAATGAPVAVPTRMYFTLNNFGSGESVVVNGVTYTQSLVVANARALGTGETPINITSAGLTGGNETIAVTVFNGNQSYTYTVTFKTPVFTVEKTIDYQTMSVAVGSAVNLGFTVKDQFGKLSTRTNTQIVATVDVAGSVSDTVSAAVVNGAASLAVTPAPATRTGSAVVTVSLQELNLGTGLYAAVSGSTGETVDLIIRSAADSIVSRTPASTSTSVSYIIDDEAWDMTTNYTVTVTNSFSFVTATAPGLTIENGGDSTDTASGTLTLQANASGEATFKFAGTVAGTHVVTFTNGSTSTTSEVIIDAAAGNKGYNVSLTGADTSLQGKSLTYTGVVTDYYGNVVDTTLSNSAATITITFTGPALVSGSLPTETDVDGEFEFTVQTANNDEGTIAVTATYNSAGASTAAADKKSASKLTTVTAPVVMTAQTVSVVVSAASVEAGRNADVTITVTDTAGNAHAYKSVVVYSTGAGYLSAQTVTTDGEGKAVVKLITAANDSGTATITASVDGKSGTATVTVAAPVVVVAPTVEAVIGTFQGRWAVRVENATVGDRITIRVGGNWYQFNYSSETGSQLFSRKSTVGAIVDVTVWVNGSQKNVGLVTIK